MAKYPVVSDDPQIQAHYEFCRSQGTGHMLAEMFAYAQPPQSDTDVEFLRGTQTARKYLSSLAEYPGDPRSYVTGKADVQKVCEERGWGCTGKVNVKPRNDLPPPEHVAIGEDIVRDDVAKEVEAGAHPAEAREKVIAKRKPHWAKARK